MGARMEVEPRDYWWLSVSLQELPLDTSTARVVLDVIQPHGYRQQLEQEVQLRDGNADFEVRYPLLDEGRYEGPETCWEDRRAWPVGEYEFTAHVEADQEPPHVVHTSLAVADFFLPSPGEGTVGLARPQFLECAPLRPILIDHDEAGCQLRVVPDRVPECDMIVDVVAAGTETPIVGPWLRHLTGEDHHLRLSTQDWPEGDYWMRVRALHRGLPVGPYCVRLFTKVRSPETEDEAPLQVGTAALPVIDDSFFDEVAGVRFRPDPLDKQPDAPLVEPDRPWEGEFLQFDSLTYNQAQRRYELIYRGETFRPARKQELPDPSVHKFLAVSEDGLRWNKPDLGRILFRGSTANNIADDQPGRFTSGKRDVTSDEARHDLAHARFRFHDPDRDGPVNLDHVFVVSGRSGFPIECKSILEATDPADNDGFRPHRAEFWPFEQRGDDFLVLTREPLLYSGVGQNLMHTTEVFRFHVEVAPAKGLYYYYRPTPPGYSPHNSPCDNLPRGRRCLAVLWTEDGLSWHRRYVLSQDEFDEPGTVFYSMRVIAPEGSALRAPQGRAALRRRYYPVLAMPEQPLYLGSVLRYNVITSRMSPELIWSRDLVRWHRFTTERRPFIELGEPGSYDGGWVRDQLADAYEVDGEWWFPYSASSMLHCYPRVLRFEGSLAEFREQHTYYEELPGFPGWERWWQETQATAAYPALARCRVGRLAHAEPAAERASLTSKPMVAGGERLVLNAAVAAGGSIRVEVRDDGDEVIPGYALDDCEPFTGDQTAHEVRWQGESRGALTGRPVRVHIALHHAKLYTWGFAP